MHLPALTNTPTCQKSRPRKFKSLMVFIRANSHLEGLTLTVKELLQILQLEPSMANELWLLKRLIIAGWYQVEVEVKYPKLYKDLQWRYGDRSVRSKAISDTDGDWRYYGELAARNYPQQFKRN